MANVTAVIGGSAEFGNELYNELATHERGNFVFSPLSLYAALAMTYAGAGGKTETQIGRVLRSSAHSRSEFHAAVASLLSNRPTLQIANALWPQAGYPI